MKYGYITGLEKPISRLIMGTMIYSPGDMPLTCTMLDYFVSLGGNTLDTAHIYGQGDSERAVGEWMRLRGNRAEIVIIGKGAHHDAHGPRVNPAAIASDLEESLQRLGTDYIDLVLLHCVESGKWPEELQKQMNILANFKQKGVIRAHGVSCHTVEALEAAATEPWVATSNDRESAASIISSAAGRSSMTATRGFMRAPPEAGCGSGRRGCRSRTPVSRDSRRKARARGRAQVPCPSLPW